MPLNTWKHRRELIGRLGIAAGPGWQQEIGTWDDCAQRYVKLYREFAGERCLNACWSLALEALSARRFAPGLVVQWFCRAGTIPNPTAVATPGDRDGRSLTAKHPSNSLPLLEDCQAVIYLASSSTPGEQRGARSGRAGRQPATTAGSTRSHADTTRSAIALLLFSRRTLRRSAQQCP